MNLATTNPQLTSTTMGMSCDKNKGLVMSVRIRWSFQHD